MQGHDEAASDVGEMRPHEFGTFAHGAYEAAAEDHFDDVESRYPVIVTKPDGSTRNGEIDTLVDGKVVIDYKTDYMPAWSVNHARYMGDKYGQQVQEYVNGEGMPTDARGWIVCTVPSESTEVRQAFADGAGTHGVGVKFSREEQPEAVMEAVSEAVADSKSASTNPDEDS